MRRWADYPLRCYLQDEKRNACVILSGNCVQVFLKHGAKINDDETQKEHAKKTMEVGQCILDDVECEGLYIDEVKDTARVLRLAGFANPKGGRLAELLYTNTPPDTDTGDDYTSKAVVSLEKAFAFKCPESKRYGYMVKLAGLMASAKYTPEAARQKLDEWTQNNGDWREGETTRQHYIENALSSYDRWLRSNRPLSPMNRKWRGNNGAFIPTDAYFFADQFGTPACRWQNKIAFVKSGEFKRWATRWLGGYYSSEKLSGLVDLCDAEGGLSDKSHALHVRCVQDDAGDLLIDLCDDGWRAVRLNANGWVIETPTVPVFRRYPHMKSIDIAETGERKDFDDFLSLLHIKDENDKLLITAVLGTSWVAGIPHPIIIPFGQKGAGKTTFCEFVRSIIDPTELLTLSLSRNEEQLSQKLMHHYSPVFDNAHMLRQTQSDMLCRASTGEGFSKRQLFTDEGDVVFKYRRCVFLNGLNVPATQPDLLDRTILLELERIPKAERKRKTALDARMRELAPRVRHYILDQMVRTLQILPTIPEDKLPRMADFAYYAEAFLQSMDYPAGTFFKAYDANTTRQVEEAVSSSLIGSLVLNFMEDRPEWSGSANELLTKLKDLAWSMKIDTKEKTFPKAGNQLSRQLTALATDLREMKIVFERGHSTKRIITLRRSDDV